MEGLQMAPHGLCGGVGTFHEFSTMIAIDGEAIGSHVEMVPNFGHFYGIFG
jgi:hypothetical protein